MLQSSTDDSLRNSSLSENAGRKPLVALVDFRGSSNEIQILAPIV